MNNLLLDLEGAVVGLAVVGFLRTSFFLFGRFVSKMDRNLQILFHVHPNLWKDGGN